MITMQYPDLIPVDLAGRDAIEAYLRRANRKSCELNFCNMFNWGPVYDYRWAVNDDLLIVALNGGDDLLFPAGRPFLPAELASLSDLMRTAGKAGSFFDVPAEYVEQNRNELELYFELSSTPDDWDYIYSAEKLLHLSGAKLRKKRNHLAQFEREYGNWQIVELDRNRANECIPFIEELYRETGMDEMQQEDFAAVKRAVEFFDRTGILGLGLYVGGRMAAFSMFSRQCDDTYTTHFEKSDKDIRGASQMINRETAAFLHDRCTYINREQDLGVPGLRHAKQSYDPEFQLECFSLRRRND